MKDNKTSSTLDILKRCLKELEGMSSEEVQRISKKKNILESGIDHSVKSDENFKELQDFAIWMTGCGYDFTQHEHYMKNKHLFTKKSTLKKESNTDSHTKISKSKGDFRDIDNFESQSGYFGK